MGRVAASGAPTANEGVMGFWDKLDAMHYPKELQPLSCGANDGPCGTQTSRVPPAPLSDLEFRDWSITMLSNHCQSRNGLKH
jgi:hypothetical protein